MSEPIFPRHFNETERRSLHEHFPDQYPKADYFLDVQKLIDNGDETLTPLFLHRTDHKSGIYPGTHTAIYGSPGAGKTMLTKFVTHQALNNGYRVLHIDLDDNRAAMIMRDVKAFGVTDHVLLDRWHVAQPETLEHVSGIIERVIEEACYEVVIIDSLAALEAFTAADGNTALDFVQRIYLPIIKPLMQAGIAVISIDHTTKNSNTAGASGSVQKLAKADLAFHVVVPESATGLTPGIDGQIAIYVEKDRYGVVKAASQMREHRGQSKHLWGTFKIPAAGLHHAQVVPPSGEQPDYGWK